jgi:hypothetical protein
MCLLDAELYSRCAHFGGYLNTCTAFSGSFTDACPNFGLGDSAMVNYYCDESKHTRMLRNRQIWGSARDVGVRDALKVKPLDFKWIGNVHEVDSQGVAKVWKRFRECGYTLSFCYDSGFPELALSWDREDSGNRSSR